MKKYWKIGISILAVVVLFVSMPSLRTMADFMKSTNKQEKKMDNKQSIIDGFNRTMAVQNLATGTDYGTQFIDKVKVTDEKGNEINTIERDEKFKVVYYWSVPEDVEVKEGDFMTIPVPKEASIHNSIEFPVIDEETGEKMGQATLNHKSNTITMVFTDYPETHNVVKGILDFTVKLEVASNTEQIEIELVFETNGGTEIIEITVPGEEESNGGGAEIIVVDRHLEKYGSQAQDLGEMNWNIKVNEKTDDLHKVVLVDTLGEGQLLDVESMSVRKGTAMLSNGNISNSEKVPLEDLNIEYRENGFTIDFGDIGKTIYHIAYKSKIKPGVEIIDEAKFFNDVIITASEFKEGLTDYGVVTYITGSGSGSGETSRNIDVTERFVDNTDLSNLAKDKVTQVEAKVNQPGRFKTETKLIDEYELISYSYKKNGKLIEADIKDGDTVELELEEDTEITYFYEKSVFAPHIYLRTKGNQLVIHYRNVDELIVYVDGHQYKTYDVLAQETDENITTPLRINSERTEVQVKGKLNGETKSEATLNSKKDNSN